jgi:sulfur-oxidizing protein SoxX
MRNAAMIVGIAALTAMMGSIGLVPAVQADSGRMPAGAVCNDKEHPPTDAVTQGGCIAMNRRKGNCAACHFINGAAASGDIAPPLVQIQHRFPDKAKLRAQIYDARKANPDTVMPPFGAHKILSNDEIDKVLEWVLTL